MRILRLTILGCYGPYPGAGGACSGYLLEDHSTKILIDCGNGVLSKLFAYCNDLNKLDAIFISHLHFDHMSDIFILRYAIDIRQKLGQVQKSIPIYLPVSPQETFETIQYKETYNINIIQAESKIAINNIKVNFSMTNHPIECYAMAFQSNKKRFVYSGDTRFYEGLIDFANDSDLFLCEASFPHRYLTDSVYHLSARQAGQIALRANVKKMILTHLLPDLDPHELLKEAGEEFGGNLEIAKEGKTYFI